MDLCYSYVGESVKTNLASFTGKAYITFQYQRYRNYFLREYERGPDFFQILGQTIKISAAEKPNDINWYNIGFVGWKDGLYLTYFVVIQIIIFFLALVALFAI
jgi:capsule polysaccharide export protein KpsC/LpsZ